MIVKVCPIRIIRNYVINAKKTIYYILLKINRKRELFLDYVNKFKIFKINLLIH